MIPRISKSKISGSTCPSSSPTSPHTQQWGTALDIYHCYKKQTKKYIYLTYKLLRYWLRDRTTVGEWEWDFFMSFLVLNVLYSFLVRPSLVLSKANPNTLTKIPFFQRGQSHFQISYAHKVHYISLTYILYTVLVYIMLIKNIFSR